jgi:hypothetical protein
MAGRQRRTSKMKVYAFAHNRVFKNSIVDDRKNLI